MNQPKLIEAVRVVCNAQPDSPGCLYPNCDCRGLPQDVLRSERAQNAEKAAIQRHTAPDAKPAGFSKR